jgi:hypothetical protein
MDQLSTNPGLDKYRIQSILKLLDEGDLRSSQKKAAVRILKDKCRIYAQGCRKRGRLDDVTYYESLLERYPL